MPSAKFAPDDIRPDQIGQEPIGTNPVVSRDKDRKLRVVLVDNSEITLKTLGEFLNSHPHLRVVGLARDGEDGTAQVELLKPDIVFMDVQMPRLNGLQATRQLRKRFPHLPIILMSVHESENWQQTCQAVGATDFISKRNLAARLPLLLQKLFNCEENKGK